MSKTQRMVWIDMEMTGVNPEKTCDIRNSHYSYG